MAENQGNQPSGQSNPPPPPPPPVPQNVTTTRTGQSVLPPPVPVNQDITAAFGSVNDQPIIRGTGGTKSEG